MRIKTRLTIVLIAIWAAIIFGIISPGWNAFFAQMGKKPLDFETITLADVSKGRAVSGDCYIVYDLIGYDYTENEDSNTTKDDNYYWLVDCGDEDVMLVKTDADDDISDHMQAMADAYWDASTWEDYAANYPGAVVLDGVFIKNDDTMVSYYNEWIEEMQGSADSWKNVQLAPYTLDVTISYPVRVKMFYLGSGLLIATIVIAVIIIAAIAKGARRGPVVQYSGVPAGNYGSMNGGSIGGTAQNEQTGAFNTAYGSQGTFQTQGGAAPYGSQSTFQTQDGASPYGSQSTFQTQGGAPYGSQSTFQTQGSAPYGSQSTFQTQGGAPYGSQSTFQTQGAASGSTVSLEKTGTVGGYQQQSAVSGGTVSLEKSSEVGGYQQSGVNYGSSVQGGINYGSTMNGYGTPQDPNGGQ